MITTSLPSPFQYHRGTYQERRLTSNLPGRTEFQATLLQVPWGAVQIGETVWIAQTGSATVGAYFVNGLPREIGFSLIAPDGSASQPTGIAYNQTPGFVIELGPLQQPAALLVASLSGQLYGCNAQLDPFAAIVLMDYSELGAILTGLCLADDGKLHLVDFANGVVITLGPDLEPVQSMSMMFLDQDPLDPIPDTFHPYNVTQIRDMLYVCYAELQPRPGGFAQFGFGKGYVSVFDREGQFVRRFASGDLLNAPWGIAPCPLGWPYPPGSILVGCAGSGLIIVYDLGGACLGPLPEPSLHGLQLGELRQLIAVENQPDVLLWTGSRNLLRQGLFGGVVPSGSLLL